MTDMEIWKNGWWCGAWCALLMDIAVHMVIIAWSKKKESSR